MEKESSNRGAWIIVIVLTIILVGSIMLTQPMKREEAIEIAMELAPEGFTEVHTAEFIPMDESEVGTDIWYIHLENDEKDAAIIRLKASNGKLINGTIIDKETGEERDL